MLTRWANKRLLRRVRRLTRQLERSRADHKIKDHIIAEQAMALTRNLQRVRAEAAYYAAMTQEPDNGST